MKKTKEFCVDNSGRFCYYYFNNFTDSKGNEVKIHYGGIRDISPQTLLTNKSITNDKCIN